MTGQGLRAVFWDFDGTLANTETIWQAVQAELIAEHGGSMPAGLAESLVGTGMEHASTAIAGCLPEGSLSPAQVAAELNSRVLAAVSAGGLPVQPGVAELLAELAEQGVPCALVSTSARELLELAVSKLAVHPFLEIIGAQDVAEPKPDPEAYLLAASRLGVPIEETLVIEDSLVGAQAGNASGAVVLAVPDTVPVPEQANRVILDSLAGFGVADLRRLWAENR